MTFPVVAPEGTVTAMLPVAQLVTEAVVPLNVTLAVAPCVEPKFDPVMVTAAPTAPELMDRVEMLGAGTTLKLTPLLALLETVTTTFPVVAPLGTVAVMLVAPQAVVVAAVPLNFTVLDPWLDPKFDPLMTTDAPTAPEVGFRLEIVGAVAEATVVRRRNKTAELNIHFGLGKVMTLFLRRGKSKLNQITNSSYWG
jgi:hypothetical protein